MEVTSAFFAQSIRKSEDGAGVDILGIFDGITSESFPYWNPNIRVVVGFTLNWNDNNQKFDLMLRIIDEDGNKVLEDSRMQIKSNSPIADGAYRADWMTGDLPNRLIFPKPGRYQCDVMLGDRILRSANIHFVLAQKKPTIKIDYACFGELGKGEAGPMPLNVFNSIEVAGFPSAQTGRRLPVFIQATVPFSLLRTGKGDVSAQLFNPRTNERIAGFNSMQLKTDGPTKGDGSVQIALNLYLIDPKFQMPGSYEVRIIVDNEVSFRLPLDVRLKT